MEKKKTVKRESPVPSSLNATDVLESCPTAVVVVDPDFVLTYANAAAEGVLGVPRSAMISRVVWDVIPEAERAFLRDALAAGGTVRDHRIWITAKNNARMLISLSAAPCRGTRGVVATFTDITDQAWVEDALQLYMDRLAMLRAIDRAILTVRPPEETARIALKDMRALVPYDIAILYVLPKDAPRFLPLMHGPDGDGKDADMEICDRETFLETVGAGDAVLISDMTGRAVPCLKGRFRAAILVPLVADGSLTGCLLLAACAEGVLTEEHAVIATEAGTGIALSLHNASLLSALEQEGRQLAALAQRVELVQEGERRRLSRELHDSVGQSLTAIGIRLNLLQCSLDPDSSNAELSKAFLDLQSDLGTVAERIRGVICDLRPPVLDDYGLYAALAWLCRKTVERFCVRVSIKGAEVTPRLPPDTELTLFRIAQEALANCIKHANAREMAVELFRLDGEVVLSITDDGKGFDPVMPASPEEHWGLAIMRERAISVGGELSIQSAPGAGTRVCVRCAGARK